MNCTRLAASVLLLAVLAAPALAEEPCSISGTISAEITNDPGFEGLYKYTLEFSWSTNKGLSHTDIFLGLENLICICEPIVVQFPDPAGTSDGEGDEGDCEAQYAGQYACMGDPTIPQSLNMPAIKFEALNGGCEPTKSGSGTLCFYSPFPPAPYTENPEALGVKAGQDTCLGPLAGTPPLGDCSVPVEAASWGTLKNRFR